MVWKVVKYLILVGFVEVGIEVVFWVEFGWNASKTLILQGVCGLKRYALPGFRLPVLKCKLRPLMAWKHTIIVQYYGIFFYCQVKLLYTCNSPAWYICLWYTNICLSAKDKNRSVVSVSRIHSKKSKVSPNPKKHHIFTYKVVTHPKNTPKNILKVVTTYQTSNTIQSQICPSHKDTQMSTTRKQKHNFVRTTRTHNKVIHVSKHSKYNTFTKLSTLYINLSTL